MLNRGNDSLANDIPVLTCDLLFRLYVKRFQPRRTLGIKLAKGAKFCIPILSLNTI